MIPICTGIQLQLEEKLVHAKSAVTPEQKLHYVGWRQFTVQNTLAHGWKQHICTQLHHRRLEVLFAVFV